MMIGLLWVVALAILLLICWLAGVVGLPGNWGMIVVGGVYAWYDLLSVWVLVGLVVLALIGEAIEFAAGAVGTQYAGGSRRSAVLAMVGALVGSVAGAVVGLPIPVVGPIVAALLFAALGATGGAMLGEYWAGREWPEMQKVGFAAFWGRLFGSIGKLIMGAIMVAVAVVDALLIACQPVDPPTAALGFREGLAGALALLYRTQTG